MPRANPALAVACGVAWLVAGSRCVSSRPRFSHCRDWDRKEFEIEGVDMVHAFIQNPSCRPGRHRFQSTTYTIPDSKKNSLLVIAPGRRGGGGCRPRSHHHAVICVPEQSFNNARKVPRVRDAPHPSTPDCQTPLSPPSRAPANPESMRSSQRSAVRCSARSKLASLHKARGLGRAGAIPKYTGSQTR